MTRKCAHVLLVWVALVAVSPDAHVQGGNPNPGIHPPNAKYRGHSYGEWAAMWWQAAFATPVVNGDHPIISGGAFQGPEGVVFLAGVFADPDDPAVVEITIPAGTPLFFPVVNYECSVFEPPPFHGDNEAELRACANHLFDNNATDLFAVIDGKPVNKLGDYRTESPLFSWGPLPEDNIFAFFGVDAPAGTTSPAVDVGVYLLLPPLSVGVHTIEFGATNSGELSGSINTRYKITVAPRR